jgi:hypothetical protein
MAACGLRRRAQVGRVPGRPEPVQRAPGQVPVHVGPHRLGRDRVVAALQDEGRHAHPRQVGAVVGEEGRLGEATQDPRVGGAEARLELGGQLRPLGVAGHHGGEVAREPVAVVVHPLEQLVELVALEAARVVGRRVPVAR